MNLLGRLKQIEGRIRSKIEQEQNGPDWLLPDEIDTMLLAMFERGSVEWDEIRSWKADAIQRGDEETVKMMDAWFAKFQEAGLGNA